MSEQQQNDEPVTSLLKLDEVSRPVHSHIVLEARVTFVMAMCLLAIGTGLIVWGAVQFNPSQLHLMKAAAGALISVIGGVVLKLHKNARSDLNRFRRDRDAMHMVLQISDHRARDEAIKKIADSLQNEKRGFWKRLFGRD
jgi:cytochrome c biogenesis protein CcdA